MTTPWDAPRLPHVSRQDPDRVMQHSLTLRIGGIAFSISSPGSLVLPESFSCYQSFLHGLPGRTDIPVRLACGPCIKKAGFRELFRAGQTWTMYARGDSRILCSPSPGRPGTKPYWTAQFSVGLSRVDVCCHGKVCRWTGKPKQRRVPMVFRYPLDQIVMMYALARKQGMILHGAGILRKGRVILVVGQSGAGKTTLSRLAEASGRFSILSDDRVIVKKRGGTFRVHGTPWAGDMGAARQEYGQAAAMVFLRKSKTTSIRKLEGPDAAMKLLGVTSIPWYEDAVRDRVIDLCSLLVRDVPAYELSFTPDASVVKQLVLIGM